MQPESDPPTLDSIRFSSAAVTIGGFRCPLHHPRFFDTGPIERQIVVFPRVAVEIAHEGCRPFVADACTATIYNRGQRYRRRALQPSGDRCDWFAVAPEIALELARRADPAAEASPAAPYRFARAPIPPPLYLRQRTLFERLASPELDPLEVEEEAIGIVEAALAAAAKHEDRVPRRTPSARRDPRQRDSARELAERAAERLGDRLEAPLSLAELARGLGVSAPHLCRSFRAARGSTLHRHRTELRLRAALETLRSTRLELTEIALAHGFSSHSHFTNAFRRSFGVAPSRARR